MVQATLAVGGDVSACHLVDSSFFRLIGALGQIPLRLPHWILIESGRAHLSTAVRSSPNSIVWTHAEYFLLLLLQFILILLHEICSLHVAGVACGALSRHLILLPLGRI